MSPLPAATAAHADDATELPPIGVPVSARPDLLDGLLTRTTLNTEALATKRVRTNDTASLFSGVPGVSAYGAGGVSSLPAIHGLGDDRVNLLVGGMQLGAACPNHMNPPLSYADPAQIGSASVIAGITPVSLGGDSIAGTITVDPPAPFFAKGEGIEYSGRAQIYYRSNAHRAGGSLLASAANRDLSLTYSGAMTVAGNYEGGGDDGKVRSSEYRAADHALRFAARSGANLFVLEAGQQFIPREGFPNQYMDMTGNRSVHVNGRYEGSFGWGALEARAYWQDVRHQMNFLSDKGGMDTGGMPMNTRAQTMGYALKATVKLSETDTLRLGNELIRATLDDWWPPVAGSMMMSPNIYININDGERTRLGTYAEWERQWSDVWSSLIGLRGDVVWMDTGRVQPYSTMGMMSMADAMAAAAFNTAPHAKTDGVIDVTALLRYKASEAATYEFGYARKSRTPNLYERYAWGRGSMSSRMIGWFGDGNGYVGNLDLKPETANTISATANWRGGKTWPWELKVTPYYTRVEDYIDVRLLQVFSTGFAQLQFINHEAELYGADIAGSLRLWDSAKSGKADLKLAAGYVHGANLDTGLPLYHLMPVNGQLTLEHSIGPWTSAAELVLAGGKSAVDTLRREPPVSGYALVNLRGSYTWKHLRFDAGIENLFDTAYDLPLGGISLGDYKATGILRPVPGMGRSFNIAITVEL